MSIVKINFYYPAKRNNWARLCIDFLNHLCYNINTPPLLFWGCMNLKNKRIRFLSFCGLDHFVVQDLYLRQKGAFYGKKSPPISTREYLSGEDCVIWPFEGLRFHSYLDRRRHSIILIWHARMYLEENLRGGLCEVFSQPKRENKKFYRGDRHHHNQENAFAFDHHVA